MTTKCARRSSAEAAERIAVKQAILRAIAQHLEVHGRTNWDELRERPEFAHVIGKAAGPSARRKFFRWVNDVCNPRRADKTRPHEGRGTAEAQLREAAKRTRVGQDRLGCVLSPSYMLRAGPGAERNIDLIEDFGRVYEDANLLRGEAVTDSDGGEVIVNPALLDASIKRRLEILKECSQATVQLQDLKYHEKFYRAIVTIIVNRLGDHPDLQAQVIQDVREFNMSVGMDSSFR